MTKRGGWPESGFGQRLKTVREEKGLSQAQLAERAGCHFFTISKLERGEQEPAWPLVIALAAALGVDCTAFVDPGLQPTVEDPARPRGRPKKADADAETTSTAAGALPPPQRKPKERKARKPKGG
jgi:transcriptional regulator with XRE-family HTH domain